ncbi:TetR/AcrR family transcriptional regulator [Streptomyces sp. NBC_00162]|uniref:TetR/AcrR family transcriptional regulator n=1 Tax=Streptomyces sp. NBC_00162 TaxID=2903629 RepID=UPI00214B45F9|nr:TetR/AcrR family transcriptional regulator [Streptomyces sp. NBC_00162]UUU43904.1 TetR/AcrR family transcriptional regulator [Streptomyces sp. NBC_00162]
MTARSPLSRQRVLEAALRVVDDEGLDGLSMRRVAGELGVETMALYRYTPSKDDLLDGLVENLFIELEQELDSAASAVSILRDEAALPWREALLGIARAMYRVALAHPHVIPLVAVRPFTVPMARRPPAVLRAHERVLALLHTAGLDEETTLKIYRAFISWVLGYIVIELREVVDNPDEPDPAFRLGLHRLPVKDFPLLRSLGPALAVRGGEEQLAAGLDALLGRYLPGS